MAVTVRQLYKDGTFLYKMKLLAGYKGLSNPVEWVHIIEDCEVADFLHGKEFVFTAGILNKEKDWMINMARNLKAKECSAFVVNLGPYASKVENDVIQYCEEVGLPLFTIPWEIRMVDMTRDFCHRIINREHVNISAATTIKNLIFHVGDKEKQIQQLERDGFRSDGDYAVIAMNLKSGETENYQKRMDEMKFRAEKAALRLRDNYVSFNYETNYFIVLPDFSEEDIESFAAEVGQLSSYATKWKSYMGISPIKSGIENISALFEKAEKALKVAMKSERSVSYYNQLGVYKVLLNVRDQSELKEFHDEILSELVKYDMDNQTEYVTFLEKYLYYNGSAQLIAADLFIHRNTVTYQVKKIEKIINMDLADADTRMKIKLAFHIKKLL